MPSLSMPWRDSGTPEPCTKLGSAQLTAFAMVNNITRSRGYTGAFWASTRWPWRSRANSISPNQGTEEVPRLIVVPGSVGTELSRGACSGEVRPATAARQSVLQVVRCPRPDCASSTSSASRTVHRDAVLPKNQEWRSRQPRGGLIPATPARDNARWTRGLNATVNIIRAGPIARLELSPRSS